MSLHQCNTDCQWHDPPLDPNALVSERVCEWRGTCSCGWIGEWHCASTHVAAEAARADYREHVEAELGAEAYYEAPVACKNCGSRHRQGVLVGMAVYESGCVRCGQTMLNPDNEIWDESRAERESWFR